MRVCLQLIVFCCLLAVLLVLVLGLLVVLVLVVLLFLVGLSLFLCLLALLLVLFVLHLLLGVLGDGPQVLASLLGLSRVVADQEVVKDGAGLDLPQVEADLAEIVLAEVLGVVGVIFGVVNLGVDPRALVGGVIDLARLPFALVLRVVDHGWLPLAVHVIVPVLWLSGVRVGDVLRLVPVLGLGVLGVVDLSPATKIIFKSKSTEIQRKKHKLMKKNPSRHEGEPMLNFRQSRIVNKREVGFYIRRTGVG